METVENGLTIHYGFDESTQTFKKIAWDLLDALKSWKESLKSILINKGKILHPESDSEAALWGCLVFGKPVPSPEMLSSYCQALCRRWLQGIASTLCAAEANAEQRASGASELGNPEDRHRF